MKIGECVRLGVFFKEYIVTDKMDFNSIPVSGALRFMCLYLYEEVPVLVVTELNI